MRKLGVAVLRLGHIIDLIIDNNSRGVFQLGPLCVT